MTTQSLGALLHAYFENHLKAQKGLRPATVRNYRDAIMLFLFFVAGERRCKLTRVKVDDLTAERVGRFLNALETERRNHVRSRNQRLVALRSFFDYIAGKVPEAWQEAERVNGIPAKRVPPPRTSYLERDEVKALFAGMKTSDPLALRDRALLLFLQHRRPGAGGRRPANGQSRPGQAARSSARGRETSGGFARCGTSRFRCCGKFSRHHGVPAMTGRSSCPSADGR